MNRAYWLWHGYFEESYVYTAGYPIFIGFLNLIIPNILHAALIWNLIMFVALAIGIYQLCKKLFNPSVARLAVLLIMTHWQILFIARQWQTHLTFQTFLICTILAYLNWMRRKTTSTALVFGILLVLLLFIRFEGIVYNALWIVGFGVIAFEHKSIKVAFLRVLPIALITTIANTFYVIVLLRDASFESTGTRNSLGLLLENSVYLEIFSWRVFDMFRFTLDYWIIWAYLLSILFIIWHPRTDRIALAFILFLFTIHSFAVMTLAPWPSLLKNNILIIYSSIFIAYGVWQFARHIKFPMTAWLMMFFFVMPIFKDIREYSQFPIFAYQSGTISENVKDIELWLAEERNTDVDRQILALCLPSLAYFERDNTPLGIYRFLGREDDITRDNSPANLLPTFDGQSLYLIVCGDIYYQDWADWLSGELSIPYRAEHVFAAGNIQLYEIDYVPSN